MATKWKKFKRSAGMKLFCFILAVITFAAATLAMVGFAFDAEYNANNRGISREYYYNILYQGKKDFNLVTSKMFLIEHRNYMNNAYEKAVFYKNGTEKDYKDYLSRREKSAEAAVREFYTEIEGYISEESNTTEFCRTFEYLEENQIYLEYLGPVAYKGETVFYYEDGAWWTESESDYEKTVTSHFYGVPEATTMHSQSNSGFREENISKYEGVGLITVIPNAVFNSTEYSGIYRVVFNEKIISKEIEKKIFERNGLPYFNSYAQFEKQAENCDAMLSESKNLYFAFVYKNGEVYSNHPEVNESTSAKEIEKLFSKEIWNYKTDYSGNTFYSSLIESLNRRDYAYVYDIENSFLSEKYPYPEIAEYMNKDLTLFVALEDNCWGARDGEAEDDVFSRMTENYFSVYNEVVNTGLCVFCLLLVSFFCLIKLIATAGRKKDDDELHLLLTDSIPLTIRLLLNGAIVAACMAGAVWLILDGWYDFGMNDSLVKLLVGIFAAVAYAFLVDFILYASRLMKNRSLMKSFVISKIFIFIKSRFLKVRQKRERAKSVLHKDLFKNIFIKLLLFVIAPNIASIFFLLFFVSWREWGFFWLLFIPLMAYDLFVLFRSLFYAYHLKVILKAIREVRNGNYEIFIDTRKLPRGLTGYAEDMNELRDGLKIAVENAIKEEKTKTQLITNVSHDLKTPLTSVITYIDLLSRCEIENEEAKEYIGVIKDKSERLKRLIEDLVEASKASAGNIRPDYIKVNLNELSLQLAAEYEDEFAARGLQLIISAEDKFVIAVADSKMSYRILDNLLNNIRKYAMPNTRVYLTLSYEKDFATVTLKNISENQLNIPAAELMERFVRGDSSRSTEGSGLGLSIAKNLAGLQGGSLELEINGDLFIARVRFRRN